MVKSERKTGWNRNQKDGLLFFVCFLFVSFECEPNAHLQGITLQKERKQGFCMRVRMQALPPTSYVLGVGTWSGLSNLAEL